MVREKAYHAAIRPPAYLAHGTSLAVILVLGFTSLGSRLVEASASPLGGGWAWQVVCGCVAVAIFTRLVALPFQARARIVAKRYGLVVGSWRLWIADLARGMAIGLVLMIGGLLALYGLSRTMPGTWWLIAAAGAAAFAVLASFVFPLVVEPLFNRFTPLTDEALRAELLRLADLSGVPVRDVLVADASRRTTALNAYVSGLGASRRIVVYDTLLSDAARAHAGTVVAHELGHVKHRDVARGTFLGASGAAAGVCLLAALLTWEPLLQAADVHGSSDARSLALVLALGAVAGAFSSPLSNVVSRRVEARADLHALDATRDAADFIAMQRELAVRNLSDLSPNSFVYAFFASHPTAPQRIALARDWAQLHEVGSSGERALS
jgi:STE24 endopeptidase